MKKLQISKEFKSLIPQLSKGEFDLLEQSILEEGIRESLIVYGDIIVDGHNRYEIAQKHGLAFNTTNKEFGSTDEAVIWIKKNQLGRRNISDFTRYELVVGVVESDLLNMGKEKQGTKTNLLSIIDKTAHNTQKVIAKKLGWSSTKVVMVKFVKQNANLEILRELRGGKISINKAYKNIKKAQKTSKNDSVKATIAKTETIQDTNSTEEVTKKYNLLPVSPNTELSAKIYIEKVDVSDKNVDSVSNKGAAVDILTSIGIYNFLKERGEI